MKTKTTTYKVVEIHFDRETWLFAQMLKRLRSSGFNTASKLAKVLNKRGVPPPPNASVWTPDAVGRVNERLKLVGLYDGKVHLPRVRPIQGVWTNRDKRSSNRKSNADMTVHCRLR